MILLDTQNFLSPEWSEKLIASGIDMSDSKYVIVEILGKNYVVPKDEQMEGEFSFIPTYTLSELLYKLPEMHPDFGCLKFYKDAPFYNFKYVDIYGFPKEYPIDSAAGLLLWCSKNCPDYITEYICKQ